MPKVVRQLIVPAGVQLVSPELTHSRLQEIYIPLMAIQKPRVDHALLRAGLKRGGIQGPLPAKGKVSTSLFWHLACLWRMGRGPALHGVCGMSAHEIRHQQLPSQASRTDWRTQPCDGWPKQHRHPSALCFPFCKVKAISPPLLTSQGYCQEPARRTF